MCGVSGLFHAIIGVVFLLFAIIGAFLIGLGWARGNEINAQLVAATCISDGYLVETGSCTVNCCTHDSDGDCVSCFRTCYNGYLLVNITGVANDARLFVGSTFVSRVSILADMTIAYPVAKAVACYYDRTTAIPGIETAGVAVQWTLNYTYGFFIAAMVMFAFAATALLVWIIVVCIVVCDELSPFDFIFDCFRACGTECDNLKQKRQEKKQLRMQAQRDRMQAEREAEDRIREERERAIQQGDLEELRANANVAPAQQTATAPPIDIL